MSKIRVNELAKEAGMKAGELAGKLIALGYPIKSHSSSLDEDMAEEIRQKVLGKGGLRSESIKKAEGKGPAAPPVETVTVRRRTRAQKEEIARKAELEEETVRQEEESVAAEAAVEAVEEQEMIPVTLQEEQVSEPEIEETAAEVETREEVPAESSIIEPQEEQTTDEVVGRPEPTEPRKLAKVVGRVEVFTPAEPRPTKVKRPVRPTRPPAGGVAPAISEVPVSPVESASGRKKGKRVVAIHSDEKDGGRARRAGKGGRKDHAGVEFTDGDVDFARSYRSRKKKSRDQKKFLDVQSVAETRAIKKRIKVHETITVGDLARRMGLKASEIIAKLMGLGVLATMNMALDVDTATLVAADFGYEVEAAFTEEHGVLQLQEQEEGGELMPRPPVVTVMGHVDHGKTSILDAIRKTDVAAGEAGGITQHIGAYHVQAASGRLTFVDTPGHAAFTEMRSRGAKVTDIVVLVVAADDGVMDQTKEAIAHARAADVPIVVAVNKIDKDNADPERVMRELADQGLLSEEWGGNTIYCQTSAKKNIGIDNLLENIQIQAEILELKADPKRKARGTVIEAQLHKGRGAVATVLVQEGTLRPGDNFVAGLFNGKVRSLTNEHGQAVEEAGPSIPVEVQGLSGVPQAGDEFAVLTDEKMAKNVSDARQLKARELELASVSKVSLDNLFEKMAEQEVKELRVVLRSDVQGTLEAFGGAAEKLSTEAIRVRVLHSGTGSITENDIHLAAASDAIIIGFNVRPTVKVKELAEREHVDIRSYDVIYHALEDIEKAMVGMLEPKFEERVIGAAEVRQTFHVPKVGTIAGCTVTSGTMERRARIRVLRDGVVVYTGKMGSLRRFKDDVKEVQTGYECGIGVENFNDIKLGDVLEAFVMDEVEASL